MGSVAISQQYATGYKNGITYADGRVNTSSASYSAGITYADGRVNTSSSNYIGGYNAGITYADGRVNTNSASYNAKTLHIANLGTASLGTSSFTLPISGLTADNIYFRVNSASCHALAQDSYVNWEVRLVLLLYLFLELHVLLLFQVVRILTTDGEEVQDQTEIIMVLVHYM
jgi:hypothetical protein